ncbi:hypothetical protein L195_g039712 [Trifolium pratense]|uniref:Uncharacterized protein n=1 Tax=Trifolium pratense TaxID=57577 RepID=A0A2K3LYQ4_TRIPR|nr:hypothetical protein L195_g039712 [Trifolium pratense]
MGCAWRNTRNQELKNLYCMRRGTEGLRMAQLEEIKGMYLPVGAQKGCAWRKLKLKKKESHLLAAPWRRRAAHGADRNCQIFAVAKESRT